VFYWIFCAYCKGGQNGDASRPQKHQRDQQSYLTPHAREDVDQIKFFPPGWTSAQQKEIQGPSMMFRDQSDLDLGADDSLQGGS
jgi:hypothetical protein